MINIILAINPPAKRRIAKPNNIRGLTNTTSFVENSLGCENFKGKQTKSKFPANRESK